jgi:two-component system KDP operon response regulator KdpE
MTTTTKHADEAAIRVLLITDQPILAEVIRLALNHGLATTRVAATADEGATVLGAWRPHVAILDMDIVDRGFLDGLSGAAPGGERLPVIGLARRGDLKTTLAAFEQGVDDLLTVPFAPEELLARVLAVLRRTYRTAFPFTPVLRLGEQEMDILDRCVRVGGHTLHLSSLEQGMLYLLAANAGRVVTRHEILDHLWGTDFVAESNIVDRHVRALRIKLQNDWRRPRYISTVPGRGYRFVPTAAD